MDNLSTFIFGLIRSVGLILLGFGVVQVGMSLKSHDPSQRANGFLTLAGGGAQEAPSAPPTDTQLHNAILEHRQSATSHTFDYIAEAHRILDQKDGGNTYTFEVENATSPQTDKSTAMSRLTNDILTQSMVDSEIKNFISAAKINSATIEYTNIKAT